MALVAARAKVGIGTVSRVINDSPQVSPEMRDRVLRAADEVGYAPSRRLRTPPDVARVAGEGGRRSRLIGVLVPFSDEPSAYQRLRGVLSRLQPHGYEVVLLNVSSPAQLRERLLEVPRLELHGLIVISLRLADDDRARLAAAPFPTVLVDTEAEGLASVCVDDRLGGRIATRHLVDLGHRRIAFVGEPPVNPLGFVSSTRREDGYRQVLREAGVDVDALLVRHGAHRRATAKQMALELMALDRPPTAVVATSDTQAIGVLEALQSLGLTVPDDVSVIGYDDIELASLLALTTVRQPLEASGARGADLVLEALASGERSGLAEELQIELVVRSSTGPCR